MMWRGRVVHQPISARGGEGVVASWRTQGGGVEGPRGGFPRDVTVSWPGGSVGGEVSRVTSQQLATRRILADLRLGR